MHGSGTYGVRGVVVVERLHHSKVGGAGCVWVLGRGNRWQRAYELPTKS